MSNSEAKFKSRRGTPIYKIDGDACRKIKIKPLRETNVGVVQTHLSKWDQNLQFITPKRDDEHPRFYLGVPPRDLHKLYMFNKQTIQWFIGQLK